MFKGNVACYDKRVIMFDIVVRTTRYCDENSSCVCDVAIRFYVNKQGRGGPIVYLFLGLSC